jgi:hypothetical protein
MTERQFIVIISLLLASYSTNPLVQLALLLISIVYGYLAYLEFRGAGK